jgi:hypothetical protein
MNQCMDKLEYTMLNGVLQAVSNGILMTAVVSCSSDCFVVTESLDLRTNMSTEKPAPAKSQSIIASALTQTNKINMTNYKYTGKLGELVARAEHGNADDVDYIMKNLSNNSSLVMTKFVDFALGLVENPKGILQLEYYLFNGTLIQRNYSSLFFNRRSDFEIVLRAYKEGRIDEIQAFAR